MEYKKFGILIDCSRCAVMKVSQLKELIDVMQKAGYNLLELCTDDTYKIDSEPYFGYLRGSYTKEEIKQVDEYAKQKGIELVPCIQTLAHLVNLVKLPAYANIVDFADILLIDEPKTYELIDKMFASLAEMYSSRNVNIGFDEAHMVGLGKYLDKHGYSNRFDLLLKHLNKVVDIAAKYGFKVHMWSDMFFKLANHGKYWEKGVKIPQEVVDKVPQGVGVCYWDYYSYDEQMYDEMLTSHESFRGEKWFAGGAWTWNGFAPLNRLSLATMKPAMRQVRKHNVENVLITLWADDGHECSYFSVLPSLYAIRQFAEGNEDEEKISKDFETLFGYSYDDMMTLDLPNKSSSNPNLTDINNPCKCLLYNDPFLGWKDYAVAAEEHIPYDEYAKILAKKAKKAGKYAYLFEYLRDLCRVLELKAELGVKTRCAYKAKDMQELLRLAEVYKQTAKRVKTFRNSFRKTYFQENKPYGWEIHEMRLGGLQARLTDCAERLIAYANKETEDILELEEDILPYNDWKPLQNNFHRALVSVSEL